MKMHIKNARPAKAPTQAATTVETESEELFKAWDEDVDGVDEGSDVGVGGGGDEVTVTGGRDGVTDASDTVDIVERMRPSDGFTLLLDKMVALEMTLSCRLECLRG